ncbi:hypothetical protein [Streptococcus plurextorum]|uniref:hypothetical protein n=1 Tax=Streptococcus plurextorum TaxID=456876 RepID=UPI00041F5031|nr:hypothetical protein [Streptococcus plurextorum]
MTKKNALLEEDTLAKIQEERYVKPVKQKGRRSIFYLTVVVLITLSVLFSLLRYLG